MHPEPRISHNWLIKKLVNDMVLSHVRQLRGIVIDLGCGKRPYEQEILAHADHYIGVDWSNTLHGLSADVIADIGCPLPFQDNCVDCAVAFEVLEHIPEPGLLLAETYRVLRPDGVLMLSVPFQWWVHEEPWDFYRFTRHGLIYLLQKAGYVDISVIATSGFWSMWILKFNYQTVRLIRGPKLVRRLLRAALIPWWWLSQTIAPKLDRVWRDERETSGYFVTASKQ